MTSLEGKVALVTGAASGIGAATLSLFEAQGARVLGTDIRASGDLFAHDVTSEADWTAAVSECVRRFGRLDILVSSAGTAHGGTIADLDLASFREQARVHVEGAFLGLQAAVRQMRAQALQGEGACPARGSIVLVSSISGIKPIMKTAAYGTAKAALLNMSTAVGVELGRKGDRIRVNAVCPGGTRTAMTETMFGGPPYWDDSENFTAIPLKDYCRPEDIAEAILYLASDDAEFVTASQLVVDGGWVLSNRI